MHITVKDVVLTLVQAVFTVVVFGNVFSKGRLFAVVLGPSRDSDCEPHRHHLVLLHGMADRRRIAKAATHHNKAD